MLTLTKYPVTVTSQVNNVFAGFGKVELEYKREDTAIYSISQGVNNQIVATLDNITVNKGEYVYVYSNDDNILYDGVFEVIELINVGSFVELTLKTDFIGLTNGGYCNYKQNYYVEYKLVNPNNNNILVYPTRLNVSGSVSGNISLNVSQVVDFLKEEVKTTSDELVKGRIELQVMYREVWRENQTNNFILEDITPIVIVYALENSGNERFIRGFDLPKIFKGYPFTLRLLHTKENSVGNMQIAVYFDELDINENIITENNVLKYFKLTNFGQLEVNFDDKTITINENTKYIVFKIDKIHALDYAREDYQDNDYLTN